MVKFNTITKSIKWEGRTLEIETGKIARQSNGAVTVKYGNTIILATAVGQKEAKEGADFFPLTVHYQEKYYAAGRFPGGFNKREGKPSEREVLTSRLIDRSIRPLFPDGYRNEVQVICTVLAYDEIDDITDIASVIGASAALAISDIPIEEIIAAIKITMVDGNLLYNANVSDNEKSTLSLLVSGSKDSVTMVEAESAPLSEDAMLEAIMDGHKRLQPVIKLIKELQDDAGKSKWDIEPLDLDSIYNAIKKQVGSSLEKAYDIADKQKRRDLITECEIKAKNSLVKEGEDPLPFNLAFKKLKQYYMRSKTVSGNRIDKRSTTDIRPISCELDILPADIVHGSALFTRGETQSLTTVTLGLGTNAQIKGDLRGEKAELFSLHYNFPPYAVGETSKLGATGRREIGHGDLARKALKTIIPGEAFPYVVRVVSEITESNGSSSMATVCASSLALMAAGVPIADAVAGIAMGLIKADKKYTILSDITGDEDDLGDMDFKVAGTKDGITAVQMDMKIKGLKKDILADSLAQAKEGRLEILSIMNKTISEARAEISKAAPKITEYQIDPMKIKNVIGPGGKHIKEICESTGVIIDIGDDGLIKIAARTATAYQAAIDKINAYISADSSSRGDRPDRGGPRGDRGGRGGGGGFRGDRDRNRGGGGFRGGDRDRNRDRDRGERSEYSAERGERSERSERGDRDRSDRDRGNRERGERSDRERGGRDRGGERSEYRAERGERGERGDRDRGDRGNRGNRDHDHKGRDRDASKGRKKFF